MERAVACLLLTDSESVRLHRRRAAAGRAPASPMDLEHAIGFDSKASNSLHVHPDGSSVIYVLGGCVVISQLKDAHNQVFLRGHNDQVTCVDLTKDGSLLASGQDGEQADVIVWEYTEGVDGGLPQCTEKYRLQEHDVGIAFCYFTHCGRFLLTVGKDKKLVVWDMHSGCIVARYKVSNMPLSACWGGRALDTKGRLTATFQLATGGEGKLTYWILDPAAGSLTPEDCSLGNQVRNFTALAFSPDATYLFAGSSSSDFTAVHVKHKVLHSTTVVGSNGVHVLICRRTDNGDRLIIGCGDGSITVLEGERNGADTCRMYSKGPPLQCSLMLDGPVRAMQLHGDVDESGFMRVLAVSGHGTLYACEMSAVDYRASQAPPAKSRVLQESHYAPVTAVAYPADSSETFATVSCDGTIRVWDVNTYGVNATGRIQTRICGMPKCLDFTGDVVFTGWEDGQIRAHEAETGEMLWAIKDAHRDGCTALAVSHNHKFLVSGGELGEVRVWEIRTREMVVNMKQHTSTVTSIKLFPDDAYVYSSSRDRTILQWDLRAVRMPHTRAHTHKHTHVHTRAHSRTHAH